MEEHEALYKDVSSLEVVFYTKHSNDFDAGVNFILEKLDDIPVADVEQVRHGKWEECFEDWRKQIAGDKCSACGFESYGASITHYHYCPKCGAKMDGK